MIDWTEVGAWLDAYQAWFWTLGLLSLGTLIFSAIFLPWALVRLPPDYFISRPLRDWPTRDPLWHAVLVVLKNLVGYVFLLAGIAMLFLPGQGLLTILIAVLWLDFPGKRRVERWLIQLPGIRRAADWLRQRYHCPPFQLDEIASKVPSAIHGSDRTNTRKQQFTTPLDSRPNTENGDSKTELR
jgi:hypothetical protein